MDEEKESEYEDFGPEPDTEPSFDLSKLEIDPATGKKIGWEDDNKIRNMERIEHLTSFLSRRPENDEEIYGSDAE